LEVSYAFQPVAGAYPQDKCEKHAISYLISNYLLIVTCFASNRSLYIRRKIRTKRLKI